MLRAALVACNLIAPKVVDGVARLLVKSDLLALKHKDKLLNITALETMLMESWKLLQQHVENEELSDESCYAMFGRMSARAALLVTKKGLEGPEKKKGISHVL